MTERKPLSISVDMDTNKMQLKLRAIAKHTEALANELDAIDNAWQCECGLIDYEDSKLHATYTKDAKSFSRKCTNCGERYYMPGTSDAQ